MFDRTPKSTSVVGPLPSFVLPDCGHSKRVGPVAGEHRALLPRPPGSRLRSCPPASAWRPPPPPLLHCAGHPTPSTATRIAARNGTQVPERCHGGKSAGVGRCVERSKGGANGLGPLAGDMSGTQRPGAALPRCPSNGSIRDSPRKSAMDRKQRLVPVRLKAVPIRCLRRDSVRSSHRRRARARCRRGAARRGRRPAVKTASPRP